MSTNFVAVRLISAVLTVVAVGQLAGIMLGTGMGQFAGRNLPEANWTLEHQTTDALFRKVMPVFFNATGILLIAASALSKSGSRWMFGAAALLIVVSIVITVRVEVPLNRTIASWTPGAAPPDWGLLRDRWLWNHWTRTTTSIVAFLCAAVGLAKI
jgi:Domain of unknown function (DUF1772)